MFRRLFASYKRPYVTGLHRPERVSVSIAGSRLSITLPPHYSSHGFDADVEPRDIPDIYERSIYDYGHENDDPFSYADCIRRDWEHYGPFWKAQPITTTDFMVSSLRVNCLPDGMSCFNPAHLEQVIMRYLYRIGPEVPQFGKKIAPVNWRVENKQGNPWVLFEQRKDLPPDKPAEHDDANFEAFAVSALDDKYLLFLRFVNFGSLPVEYSVNNANRVRDLVCGSIHWQLSDAAEARKQAVLAQFPEATLRNEREPEPWVYPPEWRDGNQDKGEPRIVILQPGDPAPTFIP